MTVTIDSEILASLEAAPVPYDFFREVHKGLRKALFELVVELGATDFADADERGRAIDRVHATIELLHVHHGHEDRFVKPLVDRVSPWLSGIVDAGHAETDADLAEIELGTDALVAADDADCLAAGLTLYRRVAQFVASYLGHMELEEGQVMTALRDTMSVEQLFVVDMELRAAIPPATLCQFATVILPAMNGEERLAMLGGIRAGAPAEIFDQVRATAERALSPIDYAAVEMKLALR